MKLIVGLGNPGPRYERTRHNIGFRVIDAFAARYRVPLDTHEKNAITGKGRVAGRSVVLAKPSTFMNLSGDAVGKLASVYAKDLQDLIVVYDDIDLPVGKLRLRPNGSPGTHNGMRSIIGTLDSENFPRLRFGIRGETYSVSRDLADYVLDDFTSAEEETIEQSIARSLEALVIFARGDLGRAMNEFNRDPKPPVAAEGSEGKE